MKECAGGSAAGAEWTAMGACRCAALCQRSEKIVVSGFSEMEVGKGNGNFKRCRKRGGVDGRNRVKGAE